MGGRERKTGRNAKREKEKEGWREGWKEGREKKHCLSILFCPFFRLGVGGEGETPLPPICSPSQPHITPTTVQVSLVVMVADKRPQTPHQTPPISHPPTHPQETLKHPQPTQRDRESFALGSEGEKEEKKEKGKEKERRKEK